jgi:hypothetical protein
MNPLKKSFFRSWSASPFPNQVQKFQVPAFILFPFALPNGQDVTSSKAMPGQKVNLANMP